MPDLMRRREIVERRRAEGWAWPQIAEEVGNITDKGLSSWWAAQTCPERRAAYRKQLRKPDTDKATIRRPCLRCQKMFDSEGAHNRLCQPCKGGW